MRTLLLLAALLALSACDPCEEVCTEQSSAYEKCLSSWNLDWGDVGAADIDDWWAHCTDDQALWIDGLDSEAAAAEADQCRGLRDRLRGAQGCDALWSAFVEYGSF